MQEPESTPDGAGEPAAPRRGRGGRPRHAPGSVRAETIGVRVTSAEYAELARLSGNLNQLARLADSGQAVVVANAFLERLVSEVSCLRQALLGLDTDDR